MLEKLLTAPNLLLLGVMVWSAFMMRNAAVKSRRSRGRDVEKELASELRSRQRTAEGQIHQLEVRLHDYDRDVAARVETTMAMLDQLIAEADQEIVRLESLIEGRQTQKVSSLLPEQRRMVAHLAGAGYSIGEIARLIGCSEDMIAKAISDGPSQNRRAA